MERQPSVVASAVPISGATVGPTVTIMFIMAYFTIPEDSETMFHAQRDRKVDYCGAALITIGFGIIIFAISQAESAPKGWATPFIIAFLVVGVSLLFGFVGWEAYVKDPLMPLKIWKQKNFAAVRIRTTLGFHLQNANGG